MSRTARPLATFALATAVLVPAASEAHWSASYSRSVLVERYLVCDGDLDARCVGPVVAKPQLLAALELAPIEPDRNNDRIVDPARDAAVFAAYFDLQEAVPALRTMLVTPMPEGAKQTHAWLEVHALRAEAAYALAELGDLQSAPEIVKHVRDFETHGHGTLWRDTLHALTRLSPQHASDYSRDFLGRIELAELRMSMPGGSSQLEALAPVLLARDRAALPVLQRLTEADDAVSAGTPRVALADAHGWCSFMAARLELGEQPLVNQVRKAFAGSYSGTMVATCDHDFLKTYGDDLADVDILLRHVGRDDAGFDAGMSLTAYDRIIALVGAMQQREGDAGVGRARKRLRDGLRERSKYPHVGDPSHSNFGAHFVALHHAALAGLGDADSLAIVRTMIADPDDRSGVADLAALRALQVGLPTAVDDAAARLALDVAFGNEHRSGIFEDLRVRLVDELRRRAPDDPRWAVALVDAERDVRERAMHAISRRAPTGTCDAVIAAGERATVRGIDDGFLVLTTLDGGCKRELERVARDAKRPAKSRGMAFEALAVLGAPPPAALVRQARTQPDMRVHLERVEAITAALGRRVRSSGS